MDIPLLIVLAVIAFAAVQSVFGVGLLLFGTPTLLLLGLPFNEVLAYLLPSSIMISLLQLKSGSSLRVDSSFRRSVLAYTAPSVLVVSLLLIGSGVELNIRPFVGTMLVVTAALRVVRPLHTALGGFARHHLRGLLFVLGIVHGASNLGGGILTLIVSSTHSEKDMIRANIAFGYVIMASLQLISLIVSGWPAIDVSLLVALPCIAALTYASLGNRLFIAVGRTSYQWSINALVISFGVVLLAPTS